MPRPYWVLSSLLFLAACTGGNDKKSLPVLGPMEITANQKGGFDTTFFDFPTFNWIDQDSLPFTPDSLNGQLMLVDFFFTTCPTICVDMRLQLMRVHGVYGDDARMRIVSHTIDSDYDRPLVLKAYAKECGVNNRNWLFVNGPADEVYNVAKSAYLSMALRDSSAAGGFLHSGTFVLLDKAKKIRGVYDGTNAAEVDQLISDIKILLGEQFPASER